MLHFLKSKPFLQDLIPNNHIDIHSHLIPGVDDGSTSIENSISLIRQMNDIGFNNIITTPHVMHNIWENNETSLKENHQKVYQDIKNNCKLDVFNVAAEYMLDSYFTKRLQTEKLLTLKDNYILVELSYINPPIQLYDILFEIQVAGYKPIIAHPERYLFYHNHFKEYEKLKNAGCLFQLNLLATVEYYGRTITEIATKLLSNNLYDFVGSDIHHQNHINAFVERKVKIKNLDSLEKVIDNNLFFIK